MNVTLVWFTGRIEYKKEVFVGVMAYGKWVCVAESLSDVVI